MARWIMLWACVWWASAGLGGELTNLSEFNEPGQLDLSDSSRVYDQIQADFSLDPSFLSQELPPIDAAPSVLMYQKRRGSGGKWQAVHDVPEGAIPNIRIDRRKGKLLTLILSDLNVQGSQHIVTITRIRRDGTLNQLAARFAIDISSGENHCKKATVPQMPGVDKGSSQPEIWFCWVQDHELEIHFTAVFGEGKTRTPYRYSISVADSDGNDEPTVIITDEFCINNSGKDPDFFIEDVPPGAPTVEVDPNDLCNFGYWSM